jgi:hypothetical protein
MVQEKEMLMKFEILKWIYERMGDTEMWDTSNPDNFNLKDAVEMYYWVVSTPYGMPRPKFGKGDQQKED